MLTSTFVYERGLPVGYLCRHGDLAADCVQGEYCAAVGEEMLRWMRSMSGQSRVRIGKRDMILNPDMREAPDYRRLLNE